MATYSRTLKNSLNKLTSSEPAVPWESHEICGVRVVYSGAPDSTWDEWESHLQKWLPLFEEYEWLDDLKRIEIGKEFVTGDLRGEYNAHNRVVGLDDNPNFRFDRNGWVVAENYDYLIIHELTHHKHVTDVFKNPTTIDKQDIRIRGKQLDWDKYADLFESYVSEYSGTNFMEAVAETCSGLMLGHDYPYSVLKAYEDLHGPEPI